LIKQKKNSFHKNALLRTFFRSFYMAKVRDTSQKDVMLAKTHSKTLLLEKFPVTLPTFVCVCKDKNNVSINRVEWRSKR
jgi:hypothetical protein